MTKYEFCNEFCGLLQTTEQYKDLAELTYYKDENEDEWVRPHWRTPAGEFVGRRICVTADSETAMIKDILRGIE